MLGTVVELWRYPVSSLGGERLDHAEVLDEGFAGDRVWGMADRSSGGVADPDREKRWRPVPDMNARLVDCGAEIRAGEAAWTRLPSDDADRAASAFMGFPVRFHPHAPTGADHPEPVAPRYEAAPVHLLTTASLRRLRELVSRPDEVDARRFRPNIVIDTPGLEGFVEREWIGRSLRLGDLVLTVTEPCKRCSFTALAQGGLAFEPEILRQVAQHGGGGFGIYCAVERAGRVRVGDEQRLD